HKDHNLPYVQDYIAKFGARKCEANALVVAPAAAEQLVTDAIEKYLGTDAIARFEEKQDNMEYDFQKFREDSGLSDVINEALEICDKYERRDEN
ncbi:MAG: hypothetical protein ACTSPB_26605, partial [Candidatus Thorarchaeota archaeon]